MDQRRSHPRSWQERYGQVNARPSDSTNTFNPKGHVTQPRSHPRGSRFLSDPDSVIVVTKTKGFGTLSNKESDKLPEVSAQIILKALRPQTHHRYRVNIYCKTNPNRSWSE